MTQIIVDAALRSQLRGLTEPLDLCDETGKVLAHVVLALNQDDYEPCEPPVLSEEELRKRENSSRWYTSEEVLKHLENL